MDLLATPAAFTPAAFQMPTSSDIARGMIQAIRNDDPVITELEDQDVYKLFMLQAIWLEYRSVRATFAFINRSRSMRVKKTVPIGKLRAHLDQARRLRFSRAALTWMRGETFGGEMRIFRDDFIEWLRSYQLPEYELRDGGDEYEIVFPGLWCESTLWEIICMEIVSELRSRAAFEGRSPLEAEVTYARATDKLFRKLQVIRTLEGMGVAEFGSRRRHSAAWQRHVLQMMMEMLGGQLTGTSNCKLAREFGLEAVGTFAHEMVMTTVALAYGRYQADGATIEDIRAAQYEPFLAWERVYQGNMRVLLPDTYGSTQFFRGAPVQLADWVGVRPDSKEPVAACDEAKAFFAAHGQDPAAKRMLPSDGLDPAEMIRIHKAQAGSCRLGVGWGTGATNDFVGCAAWGGDELDHGSIVCKVVEADGTPAVKLSDNAAKRTGRKDVVGFMVGVFGTEGVANADVVY